MKINNKEIDDIVNGLVEIVGSRNLLDIIDHLGIDIVHSSNEETFLLRSGGKEIIVLSNKLDEQIKPFVLAHEIGHAVLHDIEMIYYSTLEINKSKYELEADYFAFKLLDKAIDPLLDFTVTQCAKELCVSERVVKYVVGVYSLQYH